MLVQAASMLRGQRRSQAFPTCLPPGIQTADLDDRHYHHNLLSGWLLFLSLVCVCAWTMGL
jgi:hypothetical protein